jgi:hypothetical protein
MFLIINRLNLSFIKSWHNNSLIGLIHFNFSVLIITKFLTRNHVDIIEIKKLQRASAQIKTQEFKIFYQK